MDGYIRGERMPVMLYLCYENLKSFYMRTSADSGINKTQLSQKFLADSPAPHPGFFLLVAEVTLLRDPFSAGSSQCGCRLSCEWGEPQARGRELLILCTEVPGTLGPARGPDTLELMTSFLHLDCEGVKTQDFFVWGCSSEASA